MAKPTAKQLEAMKKLGWTEAEIADVIASDQAIDKGEKVAFDLSPEKAKEAQKKVMDEAKKLILECIDPEDHEAHVSPGSCNYL